ncbi:hypothetical protein E1B28_003902 [Marasmius oreades]|uniref:Uncharacterized protein n=1 Tax=Marasmius oreades TaxID=181124 RepID=A0A9P7UXG2_9AGAR|nr:uncharacterized protein E1B28_003902 [Marasmius oreades]KAG7096469.1 hypothetical protein E1B28_003902 [Marasmius oreades]
MPPSGVVHSLANPSPVLRLGQPQSGVRTKNQRDFGLFDGKSKWVQATLEGKPWWAYPTSGMNQLLEGNPLVVDDAGVLKETPVSNASHALMRQVFVESALQKNQLGLFTNMDVVAFFVRLEGRPDVPLEQVE